MVKSWDKPRQAGVQVHILPGHQGGNLVVSGEHSTERVFQRQGVCLKWLARCSSRIHKRIEDRKQVTRYKQTFIRKVLIVYNPISVLLEEWSDWSHWSECTKNRSRTEMLCQRRQSSDRCQRDVEIMECDSSGPGESKGGQKKFWIFRWPVSVGSNHYFFSIFVFFEKRKLFWSIHKSLL